MVLLSAIVHWSLRNRPIVLVAALLLIVLGIRAAKQLPDSGTDTVILVVKHGPGEASETTDGRATDTTQTCPTDHEGRDAGWLHGRALQR